MRFSIEFGSQATELEIDDDRLIPVRGGEGMRAIADVSDAVTRAIEEPLEFPALRRAIVPGDHVAIVLDGNVPDPGTVLGPLIECLVEAGVRAQDTLIVEVPYREDSRISLTPDQVPPEIKLVKHDPHDRNQLSYLASTKAGTRVYLNRQVVDADLVVLVGRVDFHPILEYQGTSSIVFPGLADAAAQHHFRSQIGSAVTPDTRVAARRESNEVAWLLGVQFAVQVVVGRNDEIVTILAGHCDKVQKQAQVVLRNYWHRTSARRADLVIAVIRGAADRQGFEELGAALDSARSVVHDGGRIVILSAIDATPGVALESARALQDHTRSLERLPRQEAGDVISTWQILRACLHARVYLLSRLDGTLVEDLSITPIASVSEAQRLIDQAASCILLDDAQRVCVTLESDHDQPAH